MNLLPNTTYHIYNQGNNKRQIYFNDENYIFFLRKIRTHILPHADILAYCLMPNHFHLMVKTHSGSIDKPKRSLNDDIGIMLRSYTRTLNKQRGDSGSLFRKHTKAKDGWIGDEFLSVERDAKTFKFLEFPNYYKICFNYIHNNPVKARLVGKSEDWRFSSASDYLGLRKGTLCNQELARELGCL